MHLFSAGSIIVKVSLQVGQLQPESSLRERRWNTLSPCTPVLKSRHWLPVCQRIDFRSSSLVYKARKGFEPKYIFLVRGEHQDRSGPQEKVYSWFQESRAAFSYYTPHLWNKPPECLNCWKLYYSPIYSTNSVFSFFYFCDFNKGFILYCFSWCSLCFSSVTLFLCYAL